MWPSRRRYHRPGQALNVQIFRLRQRRRRLRHVCRARVCGVVHIWNWRWDTLVPAAHHRCTFRHRLFDSQYQDVIVAGFLTLVNPESVRIVASYLPIDGQILFIQPQRDHQGRLSWRLWPAAAHMLETALESCIEAFSADLRRSVCSPGPAISLPITTCA